MTNAMILMRKSLLSMNAVGMVDAADMADPAVVGGRRDKLREDAPVCRSSAADYETPAYSNCMVEQQRRRDTKEWETLEKIRLTSQIAQHGQIIAERARRQRCDRRPDQRECGR